MCLIWFVISSRAAEEGLPEKRITPAGIEMMRRYPWPGNVRELENLVRRLSALYPQDEISPEIIETELKSELSKPDIPIAVAGDIENITISQVVEQNMQRYFASFGADLPHRALSSRAGGTGVSADSACLTATRGNQIKAAEILDLIAIRCVRRSESLA